MTREFMVAVGDATTGIAAVVSENDSTMTSVGLGIVNGATLWLPHRPGRGQGLQGRQHLEDLWHRDWYRHGQPHVAGHQTVRARGRLPVGQVAASREANRK